MPGNKIQTTSILNVNSGNNKYPDGMPHFIRVCTLCNDKNDLQRKNIKVVKKVCSAVYHRISNHLEKK